MLCMHNNIHWIILKDTTAFLTHLEMISGFTFPLARATQWTAAKMLMDLITSDAGLDYSA